MKLKYIQFITMYFIGFFYLIPIAHAFQTDISEKYNNIFSSKVLSESDVNNYQQAYFFHSVSLLSVSDMPLLNLLKIGPDLISDISSHFFKFLTGQ